MYRGKFFGGSKVHRNFVPVSYPEAYPLEAHRVLPRGIPSGSAPVSVSLSRGLPSGKCTRLCELSRGTPSGKRTCLSELFRGSPLGKRTGIRLVNVQPKFTTGQVDHRSTYSPNLQRARLIIGPPSLPLPPVALDIVSCPRSLSRRLRAGSRGVTDDDDDDGR